MYDRLIFAILRYRQNYLKNTKSINTLFSIYSPGNTDAFHRKYFLGKVSGLLDTYIYQQKCIIILAFFKQFCLYLKVQDTWSNIHVLPSRVRAQKHQKSTVNSCHISKLFQISNFKVLLLSLSRQLSLENDCQLSSVKCHDNVVTMETLPKNMVHDPKPTYCYRGKKTPPLPNRTGAGHYGPK